MSTVISTLVGVIVGAIVTWATACYYYRQAARDLEKEVQRFAGIIDETFTSLERSGWARVTRDAEGRLVGVTPRISLGPSPASPARDKIDG